MRHMSTHLREDTLSGKVTWETIEETYYKAKDAAWIYEVNVKTVVSKQGYKTITTYANHLKVLSMELDLLKLWDFW